MPKIEITQAMGEYPLAEDSVLPPNAAASAGNIRFNNGGVRPIKAPDNRSITNGQLANNAKSIYLYEDQHWMSWDEDTDVVESLSGTDPHERIYFSNSGGARVTGNTVATGSAVKPTASFKLGVPRPVDIVTILSTGVDDDKTENDITRFYTFTYVTAYGEEGPAAAASAEVTAGTIDSVVEISIPVPVINSSNITHKRIYVTETGADTEFLFVAEIPLAQTTYSDTNSLRGRVLDTLDYEPPPDDLKGLTRIPGSVLAGFSGKELCMSEPGLGYAFPFAYRHTMPAEIVGIAPTQNGVAVMTREKPVIVSGGHPGAMGEIKPDLEQACVSKRSIVDMGDYILYASPDGLVAINDGGAILKTKNILDKQSWAPYQPNTIHAYHNEGLYIGFYGDGGAGSAGFIYDPDTNSIVQLDQYFDAAYTDLLRDRLYVSSGTQLSVWNHDGALTGRWKSKLWKGGTEKFNCFKVECEDPSLLGLKLWANGVLVLVLESLPRNVFKLPGASGERWQFELYGTGSWTRAALGTEMINL